MAQNRMRNRSCVAKRAHAATMQITQRWLELRWYYAPRRVEQCATQARVERSQLGVGCCLPTSKPESQVQHARRPGGRFTMAEVALYAPQRKRVASSSRLDQNH